MGVGERCMRCCGPGGPLVTVTFDAIEHRDGLVDGSALLCQGCAVALPVELRGRALRAWLRGAA
jgi:hypothetical protein